MALDDQLLHCCGGMDDHIDSCPRLWEKGQDYDDDEYDREADYWRWSGNGE